MNRLISIIVLCCCALIPTTLTAQAPQKFNYQGIARDASGNPLIRRVLSLKLSVLPAADATVPEYEEAQQVSTNEFGLYTLQIGNGTSLSGTMRDVKWETGNKYIRVAIDPKGGTDYTVVGTNQLLSVPYALYSDKAGEARETTEKDKTRSGNVSSNAGHVPNDVNFLTKFTSLNTIGKSQIYDNGVNIGIGTNTPLASGLLHIKSGVGKQPLILESPQGVHCLFMENGIFRGYFGSFTGSGGAYPTPYGTSNADFDIGTVGNNGGKLHLTTETVPRLTITNTGNVGIGTVNPEATLHVVGNMVLGNSMNTSVRMEYTNQQAVLSSGYAMAFRIYGDEMMRISSGIPNVSFKTIQITGGNPGTGKVLTCIDTLGTGAWQFPGRDSQWANNGTHIYSNLPGNVGIGTNAPSQKLTVFNGVTTGTYTSTGWMHSSDRRLKTNITPLENSLQKIMKLRGVSYNWRSSANEPKQIGFIAQEVQKIFPEVVLVDKDGNYSMATQNLVAPLVEAVKEQETEMDELKKEFDALQRRMEKLEKK